MELLREVAKWDNARVDWNVVAKKLGASIGARECQALWRHVAYRKELPDNYEEDEQPSVCPNRNTTSELSFRGPSRSRFGFEALILFFGCVGCWYVKILHSTDFFADHAFAIAGWRE